MAYTVRFTPDELAVIRQLYSGGYIAARMGNQEWGSLEISRDGKHWERIHRCLLPHLPSGRTIALGAYAEQKPT